MFTQLQESAIGTLYACRLGYNVTTSITLEYSLELGYTFIIHRDMQTINHLYSVMVRDDGKR